MKIRNKLSAMSFIALSVLIIDTPASSCIHNVDPSSIQSVGFSTPSKSGYLRYESVSAKSLPGKQVVKFFFMDDSFGTKTTVSAIDLNKRTDIARKFFQIKKVVAGIRYRGVKAIRGPRKEIKQVIGDKHVSISKIFKKDLYGIPQNRVFTHFAKKFGFKVDPSHLMDEKIEAAFNSHLGLLIVRVEKAGNRADSTAIAVKIQTDFGKNKKGRGSLTNYISSISAIKARDLDISSVGDWAFLIDGVTYAQFTTVMVKRITGVYRFRLSFPNKGDFHSSVKSVQIPYYSYPEASYGDKLFESKVILARTSIKIKN